MLAPRAPEGRSARQDALFDGFTAGGAFLSLAAVNRQVLREPARRPVHLAMVPQGGASGLQCLSEHGLDAFHQETASGGGNSASSPNRRYSGPVQGLASVDVPDSRDVASIQEEGFHRGLSIVENFAQVGGVQARAQGFRPQVGQ